jgi:hypothetical protein
MTTFGLAMGFLSIFLGCLATAGVLIWAFVSPDDRLERRWWCWYIMVTYLTMQAFFATRFVSCLIIPDPEFPLWLILILWVGIQGMLLRVIPAWRKVRGKIPVPKTSEPNERQEEI